MLLFSIGLFINILIFAEWFHNRFGALYRIREAILAMTLLVIGLQTLFHLFYKPAVVAKKTIKGEEMSGNIIITGGCGFVGSNLAVALRLKGYRVMCFDNLCRRGSGLLCQRIQEYGCSFIHGDIRDPSDLQRCKGDFLVLIDASAEPSVLVGCHGRDALYVVHNNLTGSVNCFEWCRGRHLPVIFLSTSRVYPYDRINALSYNELPEAFSLQPEEWG